MRVTPICIASHFLMVAFITASSSILMADPVNAARHTPQGHATGHRPAKFASPTNLFESYANGRQSYPNPDRQLYLPD
jgi:hypothetical protein